MMEKIRTAANSLVVKIIFAIIILCFIFTGVGFLGFGGSSRNVNDEQLYIAKVDGEGIGRAQFETQVKQQLNNIKGGDASFIKMVRRSVLAQQIDNYLAYQFSQKIHAAISNERVKNFIKQQKVFFVNGKFDNQNYLNLLAENGFTPDSYAEILKTSLQQEQVIDALVKTSFVLPSDSEINLLQNQTRKIYAAKVDSSIDDMKDVNITEEDERKYYDEHQNEFLKKDRVKLKYIYNSKDDIVKTIKVTDNDIKKEYEQNLKKYSYPAKKEFSAIFVTDKEQADKIVKELSSGANFQNTAESLNQNNNNNISAYGKNGSLGWFVDDDSLPEFFKKAKLKKVNQISKPIPTDDGFIIIKLDGEVPSKTMDFDYASILIYENLSKQKLQNEFNAIEDKMKNALSQSPKSIEELSEKTGLPVQTTDWTSYKEISTIMIHPEISDLVFSEEMIANGQSTLNISDLIPVERANGSYDFIIQVTDYRPEGVAPFDEVKEEINRKLSKNISESHFKANVENLLNELNTTGKSDKISFSNKYVLHRDSTDLDKKVVDMVFNLEPSISGRKSNRFNAEFLEDNTAYIVVITDVDTPKEYQDISSELLPLSLSDTYHYLANDIRSKAKIEIMQDANL
ncbi:SurA N-terminal domain-containing protein [Gilliamella sp. B2889]|uniref:SurA N-terminal domain-containing protein n=1 Tax=Gilliamella sp. B2889 TaxID=2817985 RepID=UPI00226A667A|nr:SurA N-terminal domain-containing protein [Gilliamella sp. B2889]MCX8683187.1 SurA N-terminal domain-containing protein [Gilliamella sp. B2889]